MWGFQSLFWWISLLGSISLSSSVFSSGFQSLFWWISLLGSSQCAVAMRRCVVSILVLVDLAPRHGIIGFENQRYPMFQSLFWWISLLGPVCY